MHLPPPSRAPTAAGRPCHGYHPPHRKNRERRRRRGVKRRREREKKERCSSNTHTATRVRVRAERDGNTRAGRWRQLLSPGGQLPHYPLPPRARPRARCTTRPAPLLCCATDSALQSIFAPPRLSTAVAAGAPRAPY